MYLIINKSVLLEEEVAVCDSYTWSNGKAYIESGTYYDSLITKAGCDSIRVLQLTINKSVVIEETEVSCDSYTWSNGITYTESGTYYDSLMTKAGCDSISILYLTILPSYNFMDTITIQNGDSYEWHGRILTEADVYYDSLFTKGGCDSIYRLTLIVEDVVLDEVNILEQCAGSGVMDVDMRLKSGSIDEVSFEFSQDGIRAGLRNVTIPYDELMQVVYENVRAGVYHVTLVGLYKGREVFEQQVDLTFLYPSTVMRKRWNDVVAVVTYDYNGGYNFVGFQWYRNGELIPGATRSYINETLLVGTEYSVFLTEDNGTKLMSCPLFIDATVELDPLEQVDDISLNPTLLIGGQKVKCNVSEAAEVYLYDMMGNLISKFNVAVGESELEMPYAAGVYIAKIITITDKSKNIKLIVK